LQLRQHLGYEQIPSVATLRLLGLPIYSGMRAGLLRNRWRFHRNTQPGCDAVFAWSFYSQGTRVQIAVSSDLFLKEALTFFGDAAIASSAQGAFDKGRRLAQLVGERRALLILDGLEPLQYAPTSPTPGELKDQGLGALLKGLAANNHGLCVVTTRYSIPDLRAYWQTTAQEVKLTRLSKDNAVELLRSLGVKGMQKECETLVEEVKGHALTLNLLGSFLKRAFKGDIRQRDRVKFEEADSRVQGGHAFRTMAAYEKWLMTGGLEGRREAAILRLIGLFDRSADADCITALRRESIPGLTTPIVGLEDDEWEFSLTGLEEAMLLTVNRDATGTLLSLDAHPLIREYFAKQLRKNRSVAWRAAHRRLYEYLRDSTLEPKRPTLNDLEPLLSSVAHGCAARMWGQVFKEVYEPRIVGPRNWITRELGAYGSDLFALAGFFTKPWGKINFSLPIDAQAFVFNAAGYDLGSVGRLDDAITAMEHSLAVNKQQEKWEQASIDASILCNQSMVLGQLANGVEFGKESVDLARRIRSDQQPSGPIKWQSSAMLASVLYQSADLANARRAFTEAEQIFREDERNREAVFMDSVSGFRLCELLLETAITSEEIESVANRARQIVSLAERRRLSARDRGLHDLSLGYALFKQNKLADASSQMDKAVTWLLKAGRQDEQPRALLGRAEVRRHLKEPELRGGAQADLDEWEIAERGPMRLHMADIHLHRARLFFREANYPWESPQKDLTEARRLIEKCGYWRRKEELEDAEEFILGKSKN